jgi:4-amino-4-deoxy-L-arabinose transferase-like glycosyltransferase
MSSGSITYPARQRVGTGPSSRSRSDAATAWLRGRVELLVLVAAGGALNLWGLSINGWANTYYSAAVRSMTTSWHDFLFASLDRSGLMTVDKPPLSLWVEAFSARIFGFHPLSLLVPQALMGVGAIALAYDLVRRRFGRAAGFVAGLALATTPVVVAVSRHNNPDELLALCSVAALWCALRAFETRRTRWLVLSGICVGLGFETKMGVALMVVPGIAAAWMWTAPRRRLRALRQLMAGGAAMLIVGGAWPLLVTLTPAADRPWISGTSDNSILSLIFGYNGVGRISGQSGGPQAFGGGGTMFGGPTGLFRLLQSGLGDQAGWLLGAALVSGLGLLAVTRLRRGDPRSGWLIAVGGAFLTTAVVFSFAQGIFHPYYVSLLAPFAAALVGAGVGLALARGKAARVVGPLAILATVVTELVILGELSGRLSWAKPLILIVALPAAVALIFSLRPRLRVALLATSLAALLAAPATWAAETIGHATNGTFPTGGPVSASVGGPGGGGGGFGGPSGGFAGPSGGAAGRFPSRSARAGGGPQGLGGPPSPPPGAGGASSGSGVPNGGPPSAGAAGGPGGGFGAGSASLQAVIRYAASRGGGTIAVASQSTAAEAIISSNATVAGIGGFSGRESSVSVSWLASEVAAGHLRWVVADQAGGGSGDTRTGASNAISAVTKACPAVRVSGTSATGAQTVYDCYGRASALAALART